MHWPNYNINKQITQLVSCFNTINRIPSCISYSSYHTYELYELINAWTDQMNPNVSKTLIKASDKCKNEIANFYMFYSLLICMKLYRS